MAEIENLSISISANAREAIAELDKLASALGKFGSASNKAAGAAGQTADEVKDMGSATAQAGDQTGEAAEATNSFSASLMKAVGVAGKFAKGLGNVVKGAAFLPVTFGKKLISNIGDAAKGVANFFGQIKRVAMYRAIRTAIKFITDGFQEGMKNLYAWSSSVNGEFARSMNTLSTASKYAGNSIAAMAAPLINAFAPAIDFVVDKLVDMFNLFNQIFARLSGQTSYVAARKVASQWQEAAGSAGRSARSAADEIKRTLLDFDEINKLNGDNAGGGGGGGGGGGSSGSGMFETRQIEGEVSSFADQLRAAFEAGDWQALGTALGEKINALVDSIDWGAAGSKVGYYINGLFSTTYWTLETINFTKIGEKIAEFLNSAISQIDFNVLGRSIAQKLTIISDTIIGFLTNFDFGQFAQSASAFVTGVYQQLTGFFESYDWRELGKTLIGKISDFLKNVDYAGIASSFAEFLGSALGAGIGLLTGIGEAVWGKIVEGLSSVGDFFNEQIEACGGDIVAGVLRGIILGLTNIVVWIVDNIFTPFINGFKSAFGIASPASTMEEPGKNIVLGIFQGILNALANVGQWVKTNIFDPIWGAIRDAGSTVITITVSLIKAIGQWASDAWELISTGAQTIVKTIQAVGEGIAAFATNAWLWIRGGAETIVKTVSAIGNGIATFATNAWLWIRNGAETVSKTVQAIGNGIATFASSAWLWIRGGAETVSKTVEAGMSFLASWSTGVMNLLTGEGSIIRDLYLSILGENGMDFGTYVSTKLNGLIDGIKTWWNNLWTSLWDEIKRNMPGWMKKLLGIPAETTTGGGDDQYSIPLIDPGEVVVPVRTELEPGSVSGLSSAVLTGWAGLAVQNRTVQVATRISTGVSFVAQSFLNMWGKLSEDKKTLGFTGKVTSTGDKVAVDFLNNTWGNYTGKHKVLGFAAKVASKALEVGKEFRSNVWGPYKGGYKTLPFVGEIGSKVTKVANKFKTLWKNEPAENRTVSFWTKLKKSWTGSAQEELNLTGLSTTVSVKIQAATNAIEEAFNAVKRKIQEYIQQIFGRNSFANMSDISNRANALQFAPNSVNLNGAMSVTRNVAMPGIAIDTTYDGSVNAASGEDMEMLAEMVRMGVEQAMSRRNELDRQRNEYLRQINEKDFTADVSTSAINRANSRMNRRAGITVSPVGAV